MTSGQHRAALNLAQRFHTLSAKQSDPNDRLIGEQLVGVSQHYLGDLPSARAHFERVLAHYDAPAHKSLVRFRVDQRAGAHVYLARILWWCFASVGALGANARSGVSGGLRTRGRRY
jgi:hypothetical protein